MSISIHELIAGRAVPDSLDELGNGAGRALDGDAVGSVGYFEAWGLWFSGQEVDPQARLWFMGLLWWGRAGKIAAFLGGLTVILDLIGSERLRSWARNRDRFANRAVTMSIFFISVPLIAVVLGCIGSMDPMPWWIDSPLVGIAFTIGGGVLGVLVGFATQRVVLAFASALDRPTPAHRQRPQSECDSGSRSAGFAVAAGPAAGDELAVPAQDRRRCNE